MSERENVTKLPVSFKGPLPDDRTLIGIREVPRRGACQHLLVTYIVDGASDTVECGQCHERLNPMWVLTQLATLDRRMVASQARYQDEMKRLSERQRTKCGHCGKMTRIKGRATTHD